MTGHSVGSTGTGRRRSGTSIRWSARVETQLFITDDIYDQAGLFKLEPKATEGQDRYVGASASLVAEREGNEEVVEIALNDDGTDGDPVADDGTYTECFHPQEPGEYSFTAVLDNGQYESLRRSHEQTVVVEDVREEPLRLYEDDGLFDFFDGGSIGVIGVILGGFTVTVLWMMRLLASEETD